MFGSVSRLLRLRFLLLLLFFLSFGYAFCFRPGDNYHYSRTVAELFMHYSSTVNGTHNYFIKKNIKNDSHGTIHTFKNYFTVVFLVFSFSKNKLYPNGPLM